MDAQVSAVSALKWTELTAGDDNQYRGWVAEDGDHEFVIIFSPVLGYSLGWCKKGDAFHQMQEIGVSYSSVEVAMEQCAHHRRTKMGH